MFVMRNALRCLGEKGLKDATRDNTDTKLNTIIATWVFYTKNMTNIDIL